MATNETTEFYREATFTPEEKELFDQSQSTAEDDYYGGYYRPGDEVKVCGWLDENGNGSLDLVVNGDVVYDAWTQAEDLPEPIRSRVAAYGG